ncbi:GHMP kinase [Streptomyces sp. CNQ085]|uniref:GHMP family kinase ATP-binding protein n=1 Tax=Streptomyces sp. CNQ085 TaxID=2886944 RepID=UPI001F509C7F|nr:GHMP kinase [Streptomyces sp. CNQ085]MCI0384612.1 GHMP kinase [Streptomyces sp. CNQ085]
MSGTGTAGTGTGHASCHHGEILQGVFLDSRGRHCSGLVTLPMAGLGTRAEFTRRPGTAPEDISVTPDDRTKALRAAVLAVRECAALLREPVCGGQLRLSGDIPVGLGMGSSSSDVTAAVRAVADSFGLRLPPEAIARLSVRAEQASDPLMLDGRPLLFAQREGRVLEVLGDALPPVVVVGCALGGGRPVDTLSLPAQTYGDEDLRAYERLRSLLRRAVGEADPALLGRVATASARRAQHILRHQEFGALLEITEHVGAVGLQIAHSGNVAGVLFDPASPGLERRLRRCAQALEDGGIPVTRTFTTFTTSEEFMNGRAHSGSGRPTGPDTSGRRTRLSAF